MVRYDNGYMYHVDALHRARTSPQKKIDAKKIKQEWADKYVKQFIVFIQIPKTIQDLTTGRGPNKIFFFPSI